MNLHTIRRFFEPLAAYKLTTLILALEFFLWSIMGFISIFFVKDVIAVLESGVYEGLQSMLLMYLLIFLWIVVGTILIMNHGWVQFNESVENALLRKYLFWFTLLDNTAVEREGTGKITHTIQQGVGAHADGLNDFIRNGVEIIPALILTFYFVFGIHFLLWVLFIVLYGLLLFAIKYIDQKMGETRKDRHMLKKEISRIVTKVIMSKFEMLQSGRIEEELEKTRALTQQTISATCAYNVWGNVLYRSVEICLFLTKTVLVYMLWVQYFAWDVSLPYVVMFLTVFLYFEKSMNGFVAFYKDFSRNAHEITGLWDFFDSTPCIRGYEEGKPFFYEHGNIQLQNISYGYRADKKIFEDFSLSIEWGKITAFVWPSGWGKTTLVKLISGYIRPDSWEIFVDAQKIADISLQTYYRDIGYLTQEPSVFDGTIRENLLYSCDDRDISDEKLQEVIRQSNCEFIFGLAQGIDTEIGERGVRLSGGQKQRLAIAKIFLKDPKIIILDEPTSALDSVSELKVSEALQKLFQNRTVLIIAHRLQTVKYANTIFVIEDGKTIEHGTHESLIAKDWFYKQMLDLQSGF